MKAPRNPSGTWVVHQLAQFGAQLGGSRSHLEVHGRSYPEPTAGSMSADRVQVRGARPRCRRPVRGRACDPARRPREPGRHTGHPHRSVRGVHRFEQPDGVEVRIDRTAHPGVFSGAAGISSSRNSASHSSVVRSCMRLGHQAVDGVDLVGAQLQGGVQLGRPRRADGVDERVPVLVVVDQRRDVAVLGAIGPPVRSDRARIHRRTERRIEHGAVGVFDEHERRHRLEHADLYLLALTGPLAVEQRHHRGIERGQPRHLVGHDSSDVVGFAGQLLLNGG